jgi:TolB-like protein
VTLRFPHFEVQRETRQLIVDGQAVTISSRAFDLLLVLIECRDRVVSRDELLTRVWPGVIVEEGNITVQIAALRKALGPDAITTVTGRGYQFTASLSQSEPKLEPGALSLEPVTPLPDVPALPNMPSIAVLPFANLSGDPSQDYFGDGIVEDIITALARMKIFFVIARNSSFVYKNLAVDIRQVGRELGVRYVLEGSVRRSGNQLRITGQLIDTADGQHLWAERFDGTPEDVFEFQDRITERIVLAMEPSIRQAEFKRFRGKPTVNLQAYDLVWRALALMTPGATRQNTDEALAHIRRALVLDPHYAYAQAFGAQVCMGRIQDGFGDADDVKSGLRFADAALASGSDNPWVLSVAGAAIAVLGFRALGFRLIGFRYDEASVAVERALALSPNLQTVQFCAGALKYCLGDGDGSLAHWQQCMRISPIDPYMSFFHSGMGAAHLVAERFDQALACGERALQVSPNYPMAHRLKVGALALMGRTAEAKVAGKRLIELSPNFTLTKYQAVSPYRDAAFRKRCVAAYRAAGLPR